jgi:hypothetical protein
MKAMVTAVNGHCTVKTNQQQLQEYEKKGRTHQSVQWFCPCPGICTNLMQIIVGTWKKSYFDIFEDDS